MPIARRRDLDNRVRYVVTTSQVRPRDYDDGDDWDSDSEPPTPAPPPSWTPTTTQAPTITQAPKTTLAPKITQAPTRMMTQSMQQKDVTSSMGNGGGDDGESIHMTMARTYTPSSSAIELGANAPTETFVHILPPRPPQYHKGHLSQTTDHLLIAAGSIGGVIILMSIFFVFYVMRKRGLKFAGLFTKLKNRRQSKPKEPQTAARNWTTTPAYAWGRTEPSNQGSPRALPTTPPPAVRRTVSNSSQNPFSDEKSLDRQPTITRQASRKRAQERSFLLDSPPRPSRSNSHNRNISSTPSSPVLPLQTQRQSASTHNTRSLSDLSSDLQYPQPAAMPAPVNLEPAPSFRQFLFNRSYSNPGPKPVPAAPPMVSRFSWTNSQAPQTPAPPQTPASAARSSAMPTATSLPRDSIATSRSSVPRFRTIDSWVSQQASRVEEQRLREQIHTQGSAYEDADDEAERVPDVPQLPKNVQSLREAGGVGAGERTTKHQRRDTSTTVTSQTTATVFRQHPGEEVRMSTRSLVPSEVFESKIGPSVL